MMKTTNRISRRILMFSATMMLPVAFVGCGKESVLNGVGIGSTSGTSTTTTPATTSTTIVRRIVSTGKGLNFNNLVGGPSEVRLHPTTKLPSIVYYDRTQVVGGISTAPPGALKYAYMDAKGNWNIEYVDGNTGTGGCGSATGFCVGAQNVGAPAFAAGQPQVFDMQFTATGTPAPMIAYIYGSTTTKSIRVATRNMTTGEWSITEAAPASTLTGFATATLEYSLKGLRLLFDAADRPHIYYGHYTTAVASTSFIFYLMKPTGGAWTTAASTTISLATGSVVLAPTVGVTQAGAVQCAANDSAIIAYGAADTAPATSYQPQLTRCSTVNGTTGACTAWTNLDLTTGCAGACVATMTAAGTNAGLRSDLAIDPGTNKILYATYSTALPNTTAFAATQPGANTCAAFTTTAWVSQNAAAANYGASGIRIAASSTTAYMSMMDGTAFTARVAQAPVGMGSVFSAANTLLVETSATAVDGAGIAYDTASDSLWTTYATLSTAAAGAFGNDLKASVAYTADIVSTGMASSMIVDQTLSVFPTTPAPVLTAAVAADGTVGYAYFATENGTAGPNSRLYYGVRGGPATAPSFGDDLVYNAIIGNGANLTGAHPSLAFDSGSNPVISFLDAGTLTPANTGALMVARSPNGGAYFTVDRVDGIATTPTVGRFSSVDVATGDVIGVSYYDYTAGNLRLKFARKTPGASAWRKYTIDGLAGGTCTGTVDAGSYSTFKWTTDGRPVIVYQAITGVTKTLRIAYATEGNTSATYTWTCLSLDTVGQGSNTRAEGIDLVLDSGNKPHIVHFDQTLGRLRYLTCSTTVGTCITTGATAFAAELVESVGTVTGVSSKPSLKVDSAGKRWVSYYSQANSGLRLATKASADTTWSYEQLETDNSGGTIVSGAGQYATLLLNASGYPMIFYRSIENWLRYFAKENL